MKLVATMRQPEGMYDPNATNARSLTYANSDIAFGLNGRMALQGNFNGLIFYNIEDPAKASLQTIVPCPGGQGDVSIWGNLAFMSVESYGRLDCGQPPPTAGGRGGGGGRGAAGASPSPTPSGTPAAAAAATPPAAGGGRGVGAARSRPDVWRADLRYQRSAESRVRSQACRPAAVRTRIRSSPIRTTRTTFTSMCPARRGLTG